MYDLQRITDQIAHRLDRAIYVEDGSFRPLANSAQIGHIDDARVKALLDRGPTDEHLRYFVACGVSDAREPLRVPASQEHELLARVMVPVTSGARVLARIWLIDSGPRVEDGDIAQVLDVCGEIRSLLLDTNAQSRRRITADGRLLQGILNAGKNRRDALFRRLGDDHGITDLNRTYACVLRFSSTSVVSPAVPPPPGSDADPGDAGAESSARRAGAIDPALLDDVLDTVVGLLDVHSTLGYSRGNELLTLVSLRKASDTVLELTSAAARRTALLHHIGVGAIGVGGALRSSDGVDASLRQAAFAARVASSVPSLNGRAWWDALGEYRLFSEVDWDLDGVASLHEGAALLVADQRTPLAATLLAYLEREGDVDGTAEALNVHRTTLYYRMKRAREVLGEEPVGPARFVIHAALRLAELAGLCESTPGA